MYEYANYFHRPCMLYTYSYTLLQVRWVWPIQGGLLVEREVEGGEGAGHDGLPTLFSLMHPMDDLCPVVFHRPTASEPSMGLKGEREEKERERDRMKEGGREEDF